VNMDDAYLIPRVGHGSGRAIAKRDLTAYRLWHEYIKCLHSERNWRWHEGKFGLGEFDVVVRGTLVDNILKKSDGSRNERSVRNEYSAWPAEGGE
jgi:hypothetical protein